MVGRLVKVLEDSHGVNPYDDGKKKVILSIFYPTDPDIKPREQAYYKDLYAPKEDIFFKVLTDIGSNKEILEQLEIDTFDNVPINSSIELLPVILYSPGFGMGRDMFINVIESIVKSGYIVKLSGDGELMLTVLASFAQEESKNISDNVKWRIQNDFKRGKIMLNITDF